MIDPFGGQGQFTIEDFHLDVLVKPDVREQRKRTAVIFLEDLFELYVVWITHKKRVGWLSQISQIKCRSALMKQDHHNRPGRVKNPARAAPALIDNRAKTACQSHPAESAERHR
ncbi:MAG: hypothetical protein JNL98_18635 [Bryobacterales bacterium]|nr:hypothetical protein [Bryobacterales bacterium]